MQVVMRKNTLSVRLLAVGVLLSISLASCYSVYLPVGYDRRHPLTGPGNIIVENTNISASASGIKNGDAYASLHITSKTSSTRFSGVNVAVWDITDTKENYTVKRIEFIHWASFPVTLLDESRDSVNNYLSEFYLPEKGSYSIRYSFSAHEPHAVPKKIMFRMEGRVSDSAGGQRFQDSVIFRRRTFVQIFH